MSELITNNGHVKICVVGILEKPEDFLQLEILSEALKSPVGSVGSIYPGEEDLLGVLSRRSICGVMQNIYDHLAHSAK